MMSSTQAMLVIARRDFTATVMSRTFFIFLLFPVVIIGFSIAMGSISAHVAQKDTHPTIAVVGTPQEVKAIQAARARLNPAFGEDALPDLVVAEPDGSGDDQVRDLLASPDKRVVAVLTGGLDRPRLTGAISDDGSIRRETTAMVDEARQQRALAGAGAAVPLPKVELVKVDESAGSLATERAMTARAGQMILFMITVMLSGTLLSNLIEEKSNKVIEVLAAAVPVDSIFLGKLLAMLAVSLVGIAVWTAGAFAAFQLWPSHGDSLPAPAVGWPLFVLLVLVYYAANYLLLGALFLGIGSQASTVREVQTLSMPITIGQLFILILATMAVGPFNSLLGIGAAIFPFSSPMTMVARAAQTSELWPHLLALAWQALWVWVIVQLGAAFFRRNVMKSGGGPAAAFGRRRG
ncbi:MAG TPA: ABC transporter permease [Allosphingosinicella sp.]|jgi:ABC-2 type transport system permease protein